MRTGRARSVAALGPGLMLITCSMVCAQSSPETSVQQHAQKAEQDLLAHNLAGAEQEYRQMLTLDPLNAAAWTGLGVLLYGTGRPQMAEETLRKALGIDPSDSRAELFLALSRADLGECKDAEPVLSKIFEQQPKGNLQRVTGLALLGCSASAADPVPAIQVVAKLRQLYPDDPDVLYESAELFTRLWNQAAGDLMAKHPESYRVHELAGEVYAAQNNYDQAIREYSLALEQQPNLPQLHYRIGQMYLHKGGPDADDKAMAAFQKEKLIHPQSAVTDLAMADIRLHRHELDEAKPLYQEAAQLDPTLVEARIGLAKILLEQHQTEAAITQLTSITAEHPDSAAAHYVLMTAYLQDRNPDKAAAELAVFNRLQTERGESFQTKLDALLSGKAPGSGQQ